LKEHGQIEISVDGVTYTSVETSTNGASVVGVIKAATALKAVRLLVARNQNAWIAVRDIRLCSA
jgi:hypothetical protein